jgi:hypothetical protein
LEINDIASLIKTSHRSYVLFQEPLLKARTEMLLQAVLDAKPDYVELFVRDALTIHECIILKKVSGKEEYYSKCEDKVICKREWKSISPLQGAALMGDNFIVKKLLQYIPNHLQNDAAKQLQHVLDRKNSDENGSYLAPFKTLINAYTEYNEHFGILYHANKWDKLNELWTTIAESQRLLPAYALQEFTNHIPFKPIPNFDVAPNRYGMGLTNCSQLDLGMLSSKYLYALYKSHLNGAQYECQLDGKPDCAAIERLYEIRKSELKNIIKACNIRKFTAYS